ncbi:MAG: hypothetical protein Q9214_004538 [Letrouitia sp. 1 TL-2023]
MEYFSIARAALWKDYNAWLFDAVLGGNTGYYLVELLVDDDSLSSLLSGRCHLRTSPRARWYPLVITTEPSDGYGSSRSLWKLAMDVEASFTVFAPLHRSGTLKYGDM